MMQRAKKAEKGAARSVFRPELSRFGARSFAATEEKSQTGSCGPLYNVNLMDLPLQAKAVPNRTGMPDQLKAGIESLSGMDMSDVRVHVNSNKPAQLNALAYAQGNDIHLSSGQEQHLPHEAWHVVQQKLGRVRPTVQAKGVGINDDPGLEQEADRMGKNAARGMPSRILQATGKANLHATGCIDSRRNANRDAYFVVQEISADYPILVDSGYSLSPAVQRQKVVQLLNEDEEAVLSSYIYDQMTQLGILHIPEERISDWVSDLSKRYNGKRALKEAKDEALKYLKNYKIEENSRIAKITETQSAEKKGPIIGEEETEDARSRKAPQAAAPSSSTSTTVTTPPATSSLRPKKESRSKTASLAEFHETTADPNPTDFWKSKPQSITTSAPFSQSEDTGQTISDNVSGIIDKIKAWKQNVQDGCDGTKLNQEEVEHIMNWALKIKTKKGNTQRYSVVFGEATGHYTGYQMKIIGFGKIKDKNSTFHIKIREELKKHFGVTEK
jgi:hypothetical protein